MKIPSATTAAVITLAAIAVAAVTTSIAEPGATASTAKQGNSPGAHPAPDGSISHGRYLVAITGCHDCHTPGYAQSGGHSPAETWLTGSPVGFQGPWGVSYPSNLRLTVQSMTETEWLTYARAERRPPMPFLSLREMSDRDLTDVYRYIRSLGAAGVAAPAAVPPGGKVTTPYIDFVPRS